jgi:hypothetical protein
MVKYYFSWIINSQGSLCFSLMQFLSMPREHKELGRKDSMTSIGVGRQHFSLGIQRFCSFLSLFFKYVCPYTYNLKSSYITNIEGSAKTIGSYLLVYFCVQFHLCIFV